MAFYDPKEDEDGQEDGVGTGVQTGPESGSIAGQSAGPGAASSPNAPDKPGNFVGISQYLNANKPQAQKLGDQTAGIINQSADEARQGVQALNQEAQEKVKGVNSLSDDVSNKIQNNAEALTDDERNTVKNTASAQYKGPQDEMGLSAYQNAAKATQKATQNIDNSGTEEGRMNLISQVNSKPRTMGMNIFDNALLQAGGGREKLQAASQANQDVKGALGQSAENIRAQIGRADDPNTPDVNEATGAIGQTNAAQADAYKKVQDALGAWTSGFQPKVQQAQNALVEQQNRVTGDLGDNQFGLDQETMDLFGLQAGQGLYGLNLSDYLNTASPGDINAGNVATAEDYARYGALADMAGVSNPILDQANVAQAGTAPTLGADVNRLLADMQAADANYKNLYSTGRGGILDNTFLPRGGYGQYVPTNFTWPGASIENATAEELESLWIPAIQGSYYNQPSWENMQGPLLEGINKSLEKWKRDQRANNTVKKNEA